MKKLMKKTLALLIVAIMMVCSLGTIAFASETTVVALDYSMAKMVDKENPDTVKTDIHMSLNGLDKRMVYFQYDISEIPENANIKSAVFRTFYGVAGGTTAIYTFDCETPLEATTYNELAAAGYTDANRTLVVQKATVNYTRDTAYPTNDDSKQIDRLTVDDEELTASVKAAVSAGKKYYNMVFVGAVNNYAGLEFKYRGTYQPGQQLIIEYTNGCKAKFTGVTDGGISVNNNTAFSVSALVEAGDADIENVDLTVKDGNGEDVQISEDAVINGNTYTWNFADGLAAGEYTATLTATDSDGYTTSDVVIIDVKGPKTVVFDYVAAKGVDKANPDTAMSDFHMTMSKLDKKMVYFQYDLSSIPDGVGISDAKFRTFYGAAGGSMAVYTFDCETPLTATTYNELVAAGYTDSNRKLIVQKATGSQFSNDTAVPANGTAAVTRLTVEGDEITKSVKAAYDAGKKYYNLVFVGVGNDFAGLSFTNRLTYQPGQQLIIEYAEGGKVAITGATDDKISVNYNTGFEISANVISGDVAVESVVLNVKDESNGDVQTYTGPVVNGNVYTWNFSAGLLTGIYIATVTVTDVYGNISTDKVTIDVIGPKTVYIPANMIASGGQFNFQIQGGQYGYVQYDLANYIEEGTEVIDAEWYFALPTGQTVFADNISKLYFNKITDQTKFETMFAAAPALNTENSDFLVTEKTISELWANDTRMSNTRGGVLENLTADFVTVPMTDAIASAWANNENYFGFGVKIDTGLITIAKNNEGYGWPMLQVTYQPEEMDVPAPVEPLTNHILTVENGTANASVDVNEGTAVLIIAAYNASGALIDLISEDTITDNKITATLTRADAYSFKSFVLENISTLKPLLPAK